MSAARTDVPSVGNVKPWPGSAAAIVLRSLTSGSSHESTNPTAATGAAARNTLCNELAYAWMNAL